MKRNYYGSIICLITGFLLVAFYVNGNHQDASVVNDAGVEHSGNYWQPANPVEPMSSTEKRVDDEDLDIKVVTVDPMDRAEATAVVHTAFSHDTDRCERFKRRRQRAEAVSARIVGFTAHELLGLQTFANHGYLDSKRPYVGAFRVNDRVAARLKGVDDPEKKLGVLAEYVVELEADGITRELAWLKASVDTQVFDAMLDGRAPDEVTLSDLVRVTVDGQNYWPDDVYTEVISEGDRARNEFEEHCPDAG